MRVFFLEWRVSTVSDDATEEKVHSLPFSLTDCSIVCDETFLNLSRFSERLAVGLDAFEHLAESPADVN